MAIESMKATLRALALSITTSVVALFLDGVFWRLVFLLGDVLSYLGKALQAFRSEPRGRPVQGQAARSGRVEGRNAVDVKRNDIVPESNSMQGCSQSANAKGHVDEDNGEGFQAMHCRPEWVKDYVRPSTPICSDYCEGNVPHIHEGNGEHFQRSHRRPERVGDDVGPSSPLVPDYLEGNVPTFMCNVACHRPWRKWYAVVLGWQPGLYDCWDCVEPKLRKFSGEKDKSFRLRRDTENFLRTEWHCLKNH